MLLCDHLNSLDESALRAELTKCCAARGWVDGVTLGRPYFTDEAVLRLATDVWDGLGAEDWLEAFSAHPRIGDVDSLRAKFANTRNWAGNEQAGVSSATEQTLEDLAKLNHEYAERFGYIFIICATGKSADEMLMSLRSRLPNDPETEIKVAAAEQMKITILRLRKLVS